SVERRLGAGTYYVRVKRDGQDTSYHLRLFNSPQNPQNLGALLNSGRQVWDWVGNGDREDFYSFSLTATSNMSIILNEQSGDLDLQLLDYAHWQERAFADSLLNWLDHQGENVLASSRTPGLVEESINQVLAPGTYYVSVLPRQGNSNYHLALQATTTSSPVTVESPDYATSVLSLGNLQGNHVVRGSVGDEDVMDCYGFTITSARTVSLVLEELTADAELYLLRGLDWSPTQPDDTFTTFMDNWDAQVVARRESLSNREAISNIHLSTGTYFVAVRQGSGETSYSLSLLTSTATAAPGLVRESREVHESPMLAMG
ncbi:MAG: PPC domain-containing protein, partial [Magnetococcales bacterium]|nr:PPC domain-containing protein [Magnetococcales bacterium]